MVHNLVWLYGSTEIEQITADKGEIRKKQNFMMSLLHALLLALDLIVPGYQDHNFIRFKHLLSEENFNVNGCTVLSVRVAKIKGGCLSVCQ